MICIGLMPIAHVFRRSDYYSRLSARWCETPDRKCNQRRKISVLVVGKIPQHGSRIGAAMKDETGCLVIKLMEDSATF
jgi:hypothetical protein